MRRDCRERFPRHKLQRKPVVSDPSMHHGTCVTHVPWCMLVSLTRGGGENIPDIPGACATRNFTYLVRGPWYWSVLWIPFRATSSRWPLMLWVNQLYVSAKSSAVNKEKQNNSKQKRVYNYGIYCITVVSKRWWRKLTNWNISITLGLYSLRSTVSSC